MAKKKGKLIGRTNKAGRTVVRKELRYFLNILFIAGAIAGLLLTMSVSLNYIWLTVLLIAMGIWINRELKKPLLTKS